MVLFETDRLRIREMTEDDLDAMVAPYSGPNMTDFLEPLYPYEEEREYEKDYIRNIYGFYGFGMWMVEEKETGDVIGRAGIEFREGCRSDEAELGFLIRQDCWRRGFGYEAARGVMDYAAEAFDFKRFMARAHPKNTASVGLLTKLGFRETNEMMGEEKVYRTDPA